MTDTRRRIMKLEQSSTDTGEDYDIRVIWSDEDEDLTTGDGKVIYVMWPEDEDKYMRGDDDHDQKKTD